MEAENTFRVASGKFSAELYKKLIEGQTENIVVSPISIQACITLALLGASGETADEIKRALKFDNLTTEQLKEASKHFTNDLKTEAGLSIGTLMAIRQGHYLKSSFNETAIKCLDAITKNVDFFNNVESVKEINDWIAEKTAGKIRDLVDSQNINCMTAMILVNAVYFQGTWVKQFNPATNITSKFNLNENDTVDAEFMTQRRRYNYGRFPDLQCSVIELPYENSNATFLIFLPNVKTGLSQVEEKLDDVDVTGIKGKLGIRDIRLQLPKFKIEYKKRLNDSLNQLGISRAFSDQAEFDGILETPTGIKITEAVHKAFIEVNEKGTEAGAATALGFGVMSKPKFINVNYPFFFILQSNGYNIFMGRCCNPNL